MAKDVKRHANGTFKKGSSGNPGGRKPGPSKEYLAMLHAIVTPTRWRRVCRRALADAEGGDNKARVWLGNYLMGKPVEHAKFEIVRTPYTMEMWKENADRRREEAEEC